MRLGTSSVQKPGICSAGHQQLQDLRLVQVPVAIPVVLPKQEVQTNEIGAEVFDLFLCQMVFLTELPLQPATSNGEMFLGFEEALLELLVVSMSRQLNRLY